MNIANNHIMDFGFPGLQETLYKLKNEKIHFFRAGMNEEDAYQPYILTDECEECVVVFGFCSKYTGAVLVKEDNKAGVAGIQIKKIKEWLQAYKEFEHRIAYLHFGNEYEELPRYYMKQMAIILILFWTIIHVVFKALFHGL